MAADDAPAAEVTLAAAVRAAKLQAPASVLQRLRDDHAIATVQDLQDVLAHERAALALPALWRVRLEDAIKAPAGVGTAAAVPPGDTNARQWRPNGGDSRPRLVVMQGDLTECSTDAIVNAANSQLSHDGGLAAAIVRRGGRVIQLESDAWIREHQSLPVGKAMVTQGGDLPCRFVIHTVGPRVSADMPTSAQAKQLRQAVWSVLCGAEKLDLSTVAVPGISSGIFGYPRDLAAREIVRECARFCRIRSRTTTLKLETILLMNNDAPTCTSFMKALEDAAGKIAITTYEGSTFQRTTTPTRQSIPRPLPPALPPHKASGVMLTRVGASDFEVLVGVEFRALDRKPGTYVNFLGGKVDHDSTGGQETPMATACREFSEEVAGLLKVDQVNRAMEQSSRSVYIEFAKYTLFVVHLDTNRTRSLPDLYEKEACRGAEQDHLAWVSWRELVAAASPSPVKLRAKQPSLTDRGFLHTLFGPFRVSDLVQKSIASFGPQIESQLEKLLLENIVANEIERVKALRASSDSDLIKTLLGSDWKLRLTSPPMPPPAPIELLQPTDDVYKQVVSELDATVVSRVVSVRRVRVSARVAQYQQHKCLVEAIPDANCTEMEPLFHGTPERWRATAIAMNGFDLSIQLCGRSMGNGVYTTTRVATAHGYAGGSGSLLRLRGVVLAAPNNSAENTIVNAPVYVFPNPKALLPLAIVDYAAVDESDSIAEQQKLAQDEYERVVAQRRAMKEAMTTKEKAFEQATGHRLRAALNVYAARLASCQESMSQNSATTTRAGSVERSSGPPTPASRQLFLERKHFTMCLPIYEVKPQLVKHLQTSRVLIVIAETGSGKSTQLPQILLDEVLPTTETRRIAILQPRRVNAVSLCKRVSEERGRVPGSEVGYTIGRGESNVNPSETRLEFMTHGLFVQLARDSGQLMSKYCAVIVDEAHERSIDVDLSLALLKRALHNRSQASDLDTGKSFQVIVTSATIGKEAKHFQSYLDPALSRSSIFRVQGRAFPVHVEYRSDVQVQRDAVGTAGVGKVLTSYAIQTAIDLLRSTETGNILIFLPGEGSINDALEIARSDIATSATVEALDVFGSESRAFCFRMSEHAGAGEGKKESEREQTVTTCVVGFHGKITRAERDHVLNPRSEGWRLVVFTTNVAETGVTIPNVRYVVDTGLERRVRWNPALDLNEMVTGPVSSSSMIQRTGRAGRTASGICVRLFSEESVGDQIQPDVTPAVQNAMIYKVVLLDKQLEEDGESRLELLDPIDPGLLTQAQEHLAGLGALDRVSGKLTREGAALLRIGVDLRLGRFLIACARFGCLVSGVKLASLLVAADAPERLLPDRRKPLLATQWEGLVDPSGDHITLLNVIEAYEEAKRKGEEIQWCQERGFELDVFADAEASHEYLLKVLDTLHFPLADEEEAIEKAGGKHVCIRLALCAAYHDQLARPRMAATAKNGFVRVLDESTSEAMRQNAAEFADRTQARRHPPDENDSDLSSDDGDTDIRSQTSSEPDEEPIVKLASRSTLWLDDVAPSLAATGDGLVVFGSLMLTDSATRGEPTVQLVSCVTAEEVKAGAPEWCQLINFDRLVDASARETREYSLAPGMNQTILMDRGSWLTQLKNLFRSAVVATIRNGKLLVTCPRRSLARVEHHVEKQLRAMEPESVVLQLPTTVNMGKIIGKGGVHVKALEAGLQEFLSSEQRGAGRYHIQRQQVLKVDSDNKTIQITLQGASKPMMGVVVGRVQSAIVELHGNELLPLVLDASGERGQQMQQHPRLAQLLNRVAPPNWTTRDDVMLQLAHMLVWNCGVSIYGGFLRDWVVRGEAANDIDVLLAPPDTTKDSVVRQLRQFLAKNDQAIAKRLQVAQSEMKGAAYALTIRGDGIEGFDIDLVDPALVRTVMAPPGVDCDAGNLLLNRTESLRKKVLAAGDSLSEALENVRQKRFVFFYPLEPGPHQEMSVKRLRKYLTRGWTCLSHVPRAVQRDLAPEERKLIHPAIQTN